MSTPVSSPKPTPKATKSATPKKSTPSKSNPTVEDVDDDAVDEAITDPLERAVALKNKGNKYFKGGRYSQAVKCYSEAIDACPKDNKSDLSTFYQNRAAAHEQMVRMLFNSWAFFASFRATFSGQRQSFVANGETSFLPWCNF